MEMDKARRGCTCPLCKRDDPVTRCHKKRKREKNFIKVSTTHVEMYYLVHNLVKRDMEALVRLFCEGIAVEGVTDSVLLVKTCL